MTNLTLVETIYRAHLRLQELEAQPRDIPGGETLFAGELHALLAAADREGASMTALAAAAGISVPAMFKFTGKLAGKGYLRREKRPENGKEVVFSLTDLGRAAVKAHEEHRRSLFAPLEEAEAQLTGPEREIIRKFLVRLQEALG